MPQTSSLEDAENAISSAVQIVELPAHCHRAMLGHCDLYLLGSTSCVEQLGLEQHFLIDRQLHVRYCVVRAVVEVVCPVYRAHSLVVEGVIAEQGLLRLQQTPPQQHLKISVSDEDEISNH